MTVHSLEALMDMLSRYERLDREEREAAHLLAKGVARALPNGRVYTVLSDDADPALAELESIAQDVSDIRDSLALIDDRLIELKRLRPRHSGSNGDQS